MKLNTPDITPAQILALVGSILDLIVQFGVHLTSAQHDALLAFFGVLASIVFADAHVRNGRAKGSSRS